MLNNRKKGSYGESLAADHLAAMGYNILTANFRCSCGEIDLIVEKDSVIAFVEVKYRRTLTHGYPSEAVTPAKQEKIRQVANYYIAANDTLGFDFRFDVMQIIDCGEPIFEHIVNAF